MGPSEVPNPQVHPPNPLCCLSICVNSTTTRDSIIFGVTASCYPAGRKASTAFPTRLALTTSSASQPARSVLFLCHRGRVLRSGKRTDCPSVRAQLAPPEPECAVRFLLDNQRMLSSGKRTLLAPSGCCAESVLFLQRNRRVFLSGKESTGRAGRAPGERLGRSRRAERRCWFSSHWITGM